MWNPITNFVDAWKCSATAGGKISVSTFYFICWSTILLNVLSVFNPLEFEAYGCPIAVLHPADLVTTYVVLVLRLWVLTIIFFFALVLLSGWTLFSTGVLVLYWIANYVIHFPLFVGLHDADDLACLNQFWQPFGHVVSVFVLLAFVFKWTDDRAKSLSSASTNERTPLNAK